MSDSIKMLFGVLAVAATVAACGGDKQPAGDTAASVAAATDGQAVYQRCVTCHQANGEGLAATYPPLAGSEYANAANVAVPVRILMHGIQGPITVKGQQFNSLMPPYGVGIEMSNEEIASVLTYIRSSWGNQASAVTPEDVANVKTQPRTATGAVTAEELALLMK